MAEADRFEGDFCSTGKPLTPPTAEELEQLDPRLLAYGRFVARQNVKVHTDVGIIVPEATFIEWSLAHAVSVYRNLSDDPRSDAFEPFYQMGQRELQDEEAHKQPS